MRKVYLVLFTFIPFLVGYIINISVAKLPVMGSVVFYVLPLLTTAFWFYLGKQYARSTWKTIPALMIGNTTGVASLLIYLWQRFLKKEETINLTLTGISQMFSDAAPTYLLAKVAILFETKPNYVGMRSMVALQVLSVGYMIVVFLFGFICGKKTAKLDFVNREK